MSVATIVAGRLQSQRISDDFGNPCLGSCKWRSKCRNRDRSDSTEFLFHRLFDGRPRGDAFKPLRHVRIIRSFHSLVLEPIDAREGYDVGYRIILREPIASSEMPIHSVEL